MLFDDIRCKKRLQLSQVEVHPGGIRWGLRGILRVIKDYLRDRFILYGTVVGLKCKDLTYGVAQGSILEYDL